MRRLIAHFSGWLCVCEEGKLGRQGKKRVLDAHWSFLITFKGNVHWPLKMTPKNEFFFAFLTQFKKTWFVHWIIVVSYCCDLMFQNFEKLILKVYQKRAKMFIWVCMNYEWTGDIWAMPPLAETESGGQWVVHLSERKPHGTSHHREPVSTISTCRQLWWKWQLRTVVKLERVSLKSVWTRTGKWVLKLCIPLSFFII